MRDEILRVLNAVVPFDAQEGSDLARMKAFARDLKEPMSRLQWPAHFTASAVVVDEIGQRVCLIFHGKLTRWLQPGGHVEASDDSMAGAALREAREETGLAVSLHPRVHGPLDVDIHTIPARKDDPEHEHLDVRFLVVARDAAELNAQPGEVAAAKWFEWDDALALADEPALHRMLSRARARAQSR